MGKQQICPNCRSPFLAGHSTAQAAAAPGYNKTVLGEIEPPIKFNCPRCKKLLEVPAIEVGTKRACPECGQRLQVPAPPAPPKQPVQPNLNKTMLAADESQPPPPPIKYNCPNCKKPLESPANEALTKKNCPYCGQRLQVPAAQPPGSPQPNLNKTILASDEGRGQPYASPAIQPGFPPAPPMPASSFPASPMQTGAQPYSKRNLHFALMGVGGVVLLLLLSCLLSAFMGSGNREELARAQKEIEALKAKIQQDKETLDRRLEQERRDYEAKRAELDRQQQFALLMSNKQQADEAKMKLDRDRAELDRQERERKAEHDRAMLKIQQDQATAAAQQAAILAARPYWYNPGYWYNGYWYPR
jgi:DNA-directed RNA polymerase subunit RPC12/RpoP